jgi:hypothetical protein
LRRLFSLLLWSGILAAQTPMESTFLALKDPQAHRADLSLKLSAEMVAMTNRDRSPSRVAVQRFSDDLTAALLGKDITGVRAAAFQKSIRDVLSGKGSTFLPAGRFREVLSRCGVDERTVQIIVDEFTRLGQEVRGPDDLPIRDITRK